MSSNDRGVMLAKKSPIVSMQGVAAMFLQEYTNKVIDDKAKHHIERIISNADYME